ncbi:MAG: ribosome biogenesis GTP-binding protein YsxC [Clostridia bacterium]|nr:ribosome biogenesis GTP-binding protein YsxC [Clostridia bacterium]
MKVDFRNTEIRITAGSVAQFPASDRPQIILSGRSNVGKSSLINTLTERKSLARVSSSPGKTVTVNFYDVDGAFWLVDLPGYGFAKRPGEQRMLFSQLTDSFLTRAANGSRHFVIQLVDARVGITDNDRTMLEWLRQTGTPFVIAATKSDKLNKTALASAVKSISGEGRTIPFSALAKTGKEEIRHEILSFIGEN